MFYPPRRRSFRFPIFLILLACVLAGVLFLGLWTRDIPQTLVEKDIAHES